MKRLNPDTGKPFVRGDTRADGFLFYGYNKSRVKKDGCFWETWLRPCVLLRRENHNYAWKRGNSEQKAKTNKDWKQSNPEKVNAYSAKRRAAKLQRTPMWLNAEHLQQIESIYALAQRLTNETGILHHVDHIVPLLGKTVSGLHVPWNLQAIPATENMSKSNRF